MLLPVNDLFYSLQGEGSNCGMPAMFIRLAGCNVGCEFCDEKNAWQKSNSHNMTIDQLILKAQQYKAVNCVITGGEPTLYDLTELTNELKKHNIKTFLESSGTNIIKGFFDWITISPKQKLLPLQSCLDIANELKIVISTKEDFLFAQTMKQRTNPKAYCYLQPDYYNMQSILPEIIDYIKNNPIWKLSLQMHKLINIK